uniref:Uncharacterized protein n=1 Tax=Acrobeloides nanus TaxID=290746 RepID=A0A914E8T7_9BILA
MIKIEVPPSKWFHFEVGWAKKRFCTGMPNFTKKNFLPRQIRASDEEFSAEMVSDLPRIIVKIGSMSVIAMIDTASDVKFEAKE